MGTGMGCAALGGITTFSSLLDGVDRITPTQQNPQITDLRLQFMRPSYVYQNTKLSIQLITHDMFLQNKN